MSIRLSIRRSGLGLALLCAVCAAPAIPALAADAPKDVPANHWARKDVEAVIERGVMTAPGGKFNGGARVTRTELIQTMAGFGKSLTRNTWKSVAGHKFKSTPTENAPVQSAGITRYELAAIVTRMGSYAAAGIPKPGPRPFGKSEVLPPPADVKSVKPTDPVYPSMQYLAKNRMVGEKSVLATPGSQPVTGKEVAQAIAAVITAVNDMHTDEPQNRPDLGAPPSERRGGKAGASRL